MEYDKKKEITEALKAANDALFHLEGAREELKKASNWGIADILGGGLFISMIKRGKMENANQEIRAAQRALERLQRELADVQMFMNIEFETDTFEVVLDYVFDNFFSDMMVQSKISSAREEVEEAVRQVNEIIDVLQQELDNQ